VISREDIVEQSVFDFAKAALTGYGYLPAHVEMRESFPYGLDDAQFTRTIIAAGFNFDDGGAQAELGSDLKRRLYTIEFFVFGTTATWGRNVANVLKSVLDAEGRIPLRDVEQAGAPVIDWLLVNDEPGPRVERQVVVDPEPWQHFVWTTTVGVLDEYPAALV
jgi:hypothetical protein